MSFIDTLKEQLNNTLANKKLLVIISVVTIVFVVASVYIYRTYVKPRLDVTYAPNKEFVTDESDSQDAELYFFYTTWCPHCKKAKPVWSELKQKLESNKINNIKVNCIEVDCDKDADLAEKFNVQGYPTIKLVHNDKVFEYDAKPELETLEQFLQSSL